MKLLFLSTLVVLTLSVRGQSLTRDEQCSLLFDVDKRAFKTNSPYPLDSLWETGVINDSNLICELQCQRGIQRMGSAGKKFKQGVIKPGQFRASADSALFFIQFAINNSKMEIQEGYTLERYSLLKQMLSFNPGTFDSVYAEQYLNEYNNVKTLGIKTDRFGIGFGGALAYNNETWVSVSISYKSGLSRSNVKRNYERCSGTSLGLSTSHQSKYAFAISLLRANLKKGVTSLTNDVSISLIQITSPVYLNPVEFGVKWGGNTLTKPSFYYQPGIGIGWRIFSLGYSYDFLFTKEARASFSPHVVSISVIFPVTDTHNPKRYLK